MERPSITALYFDVDNLFLGLQHHSPEAALRSVSAASGWLRWLSHLDAHGAIATTPVRTFRIIRAYLNPAAFHAHRKPLRRVFEVVDCPTLTQRGKNAADMMMALDIAESLYTPLPTRGRTPERIEEYIIISGDTDFLPALRRIRERGCRSLVLSASPLAGEYQAAADQIIGIDSFVHDGLGITDWPTASRDKGPGPMLADNTTLREIGITLVDALRSRRAIPAADIPQLLSVHPAFSASNNWLGYGSLARLVAAVLEREPRLMRYGSHEWDIRFVDTAEPRGLAATWARLGLSRRSSP